MNDGNRTGKRESATGKPAEVGAGFANAGGVGSTFGSGRFCRTGAPAPLP